MNSIEKEQFALLDQTFALRQSVLDQLSSEDLKYVLPGNPSLGEILRQWGENDQCYVEMVQTFKTDWSYQHADKSVEIDIDALKAWFAQLEKDYKAAYSALTQEQVETQNIDRGHMSFPIQVNFHVYREAFLIYCGKISIYMNALSIDLSEQWQQWVG